MKCDTPPRDSGSSREPAPIRPSATERTPGTRSEMTRVARRELGRWCFDTPRIVSGAKNRPGVAGVWLSISGDRAGRTGPRALHR